MAQALIRREAGFRTKPLTLNRAAAFARCLGARPERFAGVEIHRSRRVAADSPKCWYVVYFAASAAREQQLLAAQQGRRAAKALDEGRDYVFVRDESDRFYWCQSTSGEVWTCTLEGCDCPDKTFNLPPELLCKHSLALADHIERGEVLEFRRIPAPADRAEDTAEVNR